MSKDIFISYSRRDQEFVTRLGSVCKIETCHSERLEGAKNLGLLPEIAFENEILRRFAPHTVPKRYPFGRMT